MMFMIIALYNHKTDYLQYKDKWDRAELREVKPLVSRSPMTCRWVRTIKNNNVFKSRLVGREYSMILGIDYDETFSPVWLRW